MKQKEPIILYLQDSLKITSVFLLTVLLIRLVKWTIDLGSNPEILESAEKIDNYMKFCGFILICISQFILLVMGIIVHTVDSLIKSFKRLKRKI